MDINKKINETTKMMFKQDMNLNNAGGLKQKWKKKCSDWHLPWKLLNVLIFLILIHSMT